MTEKTDLPHPSEIAVTQDDDEGTEKKSSSELDELRAQMAEMKAAQEARENQFQQTINALIQGRGTTGADTSTKKPDAVSFDDLPDPVEKREEFNRELNARLSKALKDNADAVLNSVQQSTSQTDAAAKLNNGFAEAYPELAKKTLLVQAAAAEEFQAVRARGADPLQYALTNSEAFFKKIAERIKTELGTAEPAPGKSSSSAARTAGVSSGSTGSKGVSSAPANKPTSFVDDIKKLQIESGLI